MLSRDEVAEIKAAKGIYRQADVAKAYDVHRSTIKRIWDGTIHGAVAPARDFPDIPVKYKPRDLADDIAVLLARGMHPNEVAALLNVSTSAVWNYKGVWV